MAKEKWISLDKKVPDYNEMVEIDYDGDRFMARCVEDGGTVLLDLYKNDEVRRIFEHDRWLVKWR